LNPLLVILAIVPGLLISYYIYSQDKYEREKRLPLILSFALGMLITVPALQLEAYADSVGIRESANIWMTLLVAFVIVSLNEEVFKFLAFTLYPFRQRFFNEPFDGIVYAVMIGMGFATLENVLYALKYSWEITLLRAFTAVPAHAVFAILMGYYAGRAKFQPKRRWPLLLKGLALAVLAHGVYDFFILQQAAEWLILFAVISLYVSIFFSRRLIQMHQQDSPFREMDSENEADA